MFKFSLISIFILTYFRQNQNIASQNLSFPMEKVCFDAMLSWIWSPQIHLKKSWTLLNLRSLESSFFNFNFSNHNTCLTLLTMTYATIAVCIKKLKSCSVQSIWYAKSSLKGSEFVEWNYPEIMI